MTGKVKLSGTSGYVELSAPATAGSNTLTLPTSNGSANQYLKNSGTAGELEFATLDGGKILQVVMSEKTDVYSQSGTASYTDIPGTDQAGAGSIWCCKITLPNAGSKVLVNYSINIGSGNSHAGGKMFRDSTEINRGDAAGSRERGFFSYYAATGPHYYTQDNISGTYLDTPTYTAGDTLTYKIQLGTPNSSAYTIILGGNGNTADGNYNTRTSQHITLMEVGA